MAWALAIILWILGGVGAYEGAVAEADALTADDPDKEGAEIARNSWQVKAAIITVAVFWPIAVLYDMIWGDKNGN